MSEVVRKLWGAKPAFVNTSVKNTLGLLCLHYREKAVGLKVQPKKWKEDRLKDCYYIVRKIKEPRTPKKGPVYFGTLFWEGHKVGGIVPLRRKIDDEWVIYEDQIQKKDTSTTLTSAQ